ncbi:MAG: hypothetical protein ACP5EQ_00150 [Candidatus Cloacimonadia bacterium]
MRGKRFFVGIILISLVLLPALGQSVEIGEGDLDKIAEYFQISFLPTEGRVYYCEIISDNVHLLQLATESQSELINELDATLAIADANDWKAVIDKINNQLLPLADSIEDSKQKQMIKDLLELQKYICEMEIDYVGIPKDFESNITDHLTGDGEYTLKGVSVHISDCSIITIGDTSIHLSGCTKLTFSYTLPKIF